MTAVDIRNLGTFSQYAPSIKRATHTMSTGQSVHVFVDTNLAMGGNGALNVTGIPALYLYYSTDATRTAFSSNGFQLAVAPALAAKGAVISSCMLSNGNVLVAYQGSDNSLRLATLVWSGSSYGSLTEQTIISGNSVTNRFRAVDIDAISSGTGVIVSVVEANASTGQGAYARAYLRKDDNTTWVKVWEDNYLPTQFIQSQSEDISVAWNAAGISSNVGQFAIAYTRSHTAAELGDKALELSVNINTATTNSATTVGTWFSGLNSNQVQGLHRVWLFSEASGVWMFGTAVGSTVPFFATARLYHNVFTGIVYNRTSTATSTGGTFHATSSFYAIDRRIFPPGAVAADYCDGRFMFAYAGFGYLVNYAARTVVMRYSTITTTTSALAIDTTARILDNGHSYQDGVVAVYGGGNERINVGDLQHNFSLFYGKSGSYTAFTTYDTFDRTVSNGWGSDNGGYPWTVIGTASGYAVNGSAATMAITNTNTAYGATNAQPSVADSTQYVDFTLNQVPTGANFVAGLVARWTSSSNFYEVDCSVSPAAAVAIQFNKTVSGSFSGIGSAFVTGLTHTAGQTYRLKMTLSGTSLTASIWVVGTAEPSSPQLSVTDSSLSAAGIGGVRASRTTGNTNTSPSFTWDNYMVCPTSVNLTNVTKKMRALAEDVPSIPTILTPTNSSVVAKNKLTMQVQAQSLNLYSNVLGKLEVQFATDAAFSLNLRTVTEDDSKFASLSATTGTTPPIRTISITLDDSNKLFTGTWYARARMLDDLGGASGYSDIVTFSVYHPPTCNVTSPAPNANLLFNSGNVTFAWKFSDTEPSDTQSAYQVIVSRQDTGAIVWDSGKVASALKSVTNNFSSGLKDIPMQVGIALWDAGDSKGPSSNTITFTILDPPSVSITSPVTGAVVATAIPTVTWSFTVGGTRIQKAYRVYIYDRDTSPDTLVGDSGWQPGTASSYTFPAQVLQQSDDLGAFVYDFESGVTGWTPNSATFVSSSAQAKTGTKSGLLTVTGTPSQAYARSAQQAVVPGEQYYAEQWTYMPVAGTASCSIDWLDSLGAYISTSSSGQTAHAATTWEYRIATGTAPANAAFMVVGPTLGGSPATGLQLYVDDVKADAYNYQVYVDVQDSIGLTASDNERFVTDWIPPALAGGRAVAVDAFKATVTWNNSAQDASWVSYRVYRRYMHSAVSDLDVDNTAGTWELMYETDDAQTNYTFNDYLYPFGKNVDYTVVQLVDRFGSLIESNITSFTTINYIGERYYFVPEVPIGTIAAFEAAYITADGFTHEVEQETIHVKGRGRQMQVGDDLGYIGTLTVKLRNPATARRDREFFEFLSSDDAGNVWMRSPFGDVLYVAFGNVQVSRVPGVGTSDLCDLSVPYAVVFSDLRVTRTV